MLSSEETPNAAPAASAAPAADTNVPVEHLHRMADLYHVPMSESSIQEIAKSEPHVPKETASALEDYFKTVSQGLFPTFAKQIKSGIPTAHLLDPYRQVAKMVLGDHVEPDFIGDPKWGKAVNGGRDQDGRPIPMGLDEWKQHIMMDKDYGYDRTPQAMLHANKIIDMLSQAFEGGHQ